MYDINRPTYTCIKFNNLEWDVTISSGCENI